MMEEEELVAFFFFESVRATVGYPRTRQQILSFIQQIVDSKGLKAHVTEGWWQRFSGRHPQLVLRTAISLSYSRAIAKDGDVINHYYDLLEESLLENETSRDYL